MHTPAHLILGAAAFAKIDRPDTLWAALLGGLIPDLSLYLLAGGALFIFQISPQIVFGELYFSAQWQRIFAIDNSVFIWTALFSLAYLRKSHWGIAFCASALLHILFDFPLHHDDGRAHFWPLTDWVYQSPISYWDVNHHAWIIAPIETVACAVALLLLWKRYQGMGYKAMLCVLGVAQLALLFFLVTHMS